MLTTQSTLLRLVASFLLASGPTRQPLQPLWRQLPQSHLYSRTNQSPAASSIKSELRRKIAEGPSFNTNLAGWSAAHTSFTSGPKVLGPTMQLLLHTPPGFLGGTGRRGQSSSSSLASILLAPSMNYINPTLWWADTRPWHGNITTLDHLESPLKIGTVCFKHWVPIYTIKHLPLGLIRKPACVASSSSRSLYPHGARGYCSPVEGIGALIPYLTTNWSTFVFCR